MTSSGCTEGVEWPHYEVRVKEDLIEREVAAEQLSFKTLKDAGVEAINTLYHARARTCPDADENAAGLRGAFTKTLFMKDLSEPPVYWLVLTVGSARPDLTLLKKTLKAKSKMRMCDEKDLLDRLGVTPGAVTPLALVNDRPEEGKKPIRFVVDRVFWKNPDYEGMLNVHPMHNAASTTLTIDGLIKYVQYTGHGIHAYIDTTVTPMAIEILDKSVLEEEPKPAPKPKPPKPAESQQKAKKEKKPAESPEVMTMRKSFASAFCLSAVGAALGNADGCLKGTGSSAASALDAICAHAGVDAGSDYASAILAIEMAFNASAEKAKWQMPAHVVLHLAAAEALLSGKHGDDLAALIKTRFASTDASTRISDTRPNNAEGACRSLCFGLAFRHADLPQLFNSVLACSEGDISSRIAACVSAFFARCAITHVDINSWKHELVTSVLPSIKTMIPEASAVDDAITMWNKFSEMRNLGEKGPAKFQDDWIQPTVRDKFYAELFGDLMDKDSALCDMIVAYDALLFAEATERAKARWGILLAHGSFGSTSSCVMTIASFCYGAIHQFDGVPDKHTRKLEQASNLSRIASKLFDLFKP